MKLVVKIPKDKLPFLGIVLDGPDYKNNDLNEDLILEHKYAEYHIVLEFIRDFINIKLIAQESLIVRFYNHVEFDKEKLRNWMYLADLSKGFNFSHVKIENNKELVYRTKTNNKLFVLNISSYEIQSQDTLSQKEFNKF
jgi:hypothetical protein